MIQRHIKNNLESFVISALLRKANKKTKLRNYKVGLQKRTRERCGRHCFNERSGASEETTRKEPEGGWGETMPLKSNFDSFIFLFFFYFNF